MRIIPWSPTVPLKKPPYHPALQLKFTAQPSNPFQAHPDSCKLKNNPFTLHFHLAADGLNMTHWEHNFTIEEMSKITDFKKDKRAAYRISDIFLNTKAKLYKL